MSLHRLPKLRTHAHNNWYCLVTGDESESWFDYEHVRSRIWTARDENAPEVANRTIVTSKSTLTADCVIESPWVPFHVVTVLPPGASFNATWFIEQNLGPLLCVTRSSRMADRLEFNAKKFVVHIDIDNASASNARVSQNFFEHNPLKRLRHSLYSSDISLSDFCFYLFGKVKNVLIGRAISHEINLLDVVTEILSGSSHHELQAVFRSWELG
jgi:hypothetical protein